MSSAFWAIFFGIVSFIGIPALFIILTESRRFHFHYWKAIAFKHLPHPEAPSNYGVLGILCKCTKCMKTKRVYDGLYHGIPVDYMEEHYPEFGTWK